MPRQPILTPLLLLLLLSAGVAPAQTEPAATVVEPRAFGYSVGDVLQRRVQLSLPPGWTLDLASLPKTRRPGQSIELRAVRLADDELQLDYQVFRAPTAVQTLEIAPMRLRFAGPADREAFVRIDAWPVTVAPLVPVDVSPRVGLGELQPDVAPPAIDTEARRQRLAGYALLMALPLAYLLHVYVGLPWWGRRQRPFARAWQAMRRLPAAPSAAQRRAALRLLHEALNASAGEVVFEAGLGRFVAAQPRFAPLRERLTAFFRRSHDEFFAGHDGAADLQWLRELCRDCRDVERGSA